MNALPRWPADCCQMGPRTAASRDRWQLPLYGFKRRRKEKFPHRFALAASFQTRTEVATRAVVSVSSLEAKQGDKSRLSRYTGWKQTTENLPRRPSAVYLLGSLAGESSKQFIDTITLYAIAILTTQMKTPFHKIYDASCLPLGRLS